MQRIEREYFDYVFTYDSLGRMTQVQTDKAGSVKEDLLEEMMKNKEKNAVVILDKRTDSDPNMQIQKSYQITNKKQQKQICRIMLNYNTANPVDRSSPFLSVKLPLANSYLCTNPAINFTG